LAETLNLFGQHYTANYLRKGDRRERIADASDKCTLLPAIWTVEEPLVIDELGQGSRFSEGIVDPD